MEGRFIQSMSIQAKPGHVPGITLDDVERKVDAICKKYGGAEVRPSPALGSLSGAPKPFSLTLSQRDEFIKDWNSGKQYKYLCAKYGVGTTVITRLRKTYQLKPRHVR